MNRRMYFTVLTICMLFAAIGIGGKTVYADSDGIVVSNITSTGAYVDWSGLQGIYAAKGQTVTGYDMNVAGQQICSNSTTTAVTLTNLTPGTYYSIELIVYYMFEDGESNWGYEWASFETLGSGGSVDSGNIDIPTQPQPQPQPENPSYYQLAVPTMERATLIDTTAYVSAANAGVCEGLEFQVTDEKTKQVIKLETAYAYGTEIYGIRADRIYSVQVRSFGYDSNYDRVYSQWSEKKYMVAQPTINTNKSKLKTHSIKVVWKKISGAKNYTVNIRKRGSKKWSKVTTTKKNTYTIKKIKRKKVNLKKTNYEVMIVANAKINGKTCKSDNSKYIYTYTYYR